jgi:tetratricopeptide (TPR) repeat protein
MFVQHELALSLYTIRDLKAALKIWGKLVADHPENAAFRLSLAQCLARAGRREEALPHAEAAVEMRTEWTDGLTFVAELLRELGRDEQAREFESQAKFHSYFGDFARIPYSPEAAQSIDSLKAGGEEARKELNRLAKRNDDISLTLVATFAWHHYHDENEARAFEILEAHGPRAASVLRHMARKAESICIIRHALHSLARIGDRESFELMVEVLPQDIRAPHIADAAGALALLEDPRAVPHLIEMVSREEPKTDSDVFMADVGFKSARVRAALALGAFDTAESLEALRGLLADPDVGGAANAALYRLTGSSQYLAATEKAIGEDDLYSMFIIDSFNESKKPHIVKLVKRMASKKAREKP